MGTAQIVPRAIVLCTAAVGAGAKHVTQRFPFIAVSPEAGLGTQFRAESTHAAQTQLVIVTFFGRRGARAGSPPAYPPIVGLRLGLVRTAPI